MVCHSPLGLALVRWLLAYLQAQQMVARDGTPERFIVHADQELPAFLELESAIKTDRHNHECDCPVPDEELGSNG